MANPPPAHMPPPTAPDADRHSASIGAGRIAAAGGGGGGTGGDGKVSFSGLAEPCAIGSLVEVVINAQGATQGSVLVEAIAPTGKVHRCQVHQRGNTFTATFTPNEVGEWQIAIMYDSEHIRGSPFVCHVYDANLVRVYGLDVGVVGQELKFNVNTSQAGRGDIQVQVSHHGRSISSYLEKQGSHLYRVQFTPDGAGNYKIHVYFNNMEVRGSPFSLDIVDASSVSVYGDNLRMASVDKLATFMIHAVGADSKDLTVTINAPSGKKKRARVVPMGDSTYRVEWKPVEAGEHYIDVRLYNQSVQDGPFSCNVGDPDLVTVRNMPTHLKHTDLGEAQTFEIDASAAGSGNLEILINGGRVGCKVKELGNRLYLATFIPVHPVTHVVEMRFNGEPVKGSPWRIEVSLPSGGDTTTTTSTMMTTMGAPPGFPLGSVFLAALPGGQSPGNYAAYLTAAPPGFHIPGGNVMTTGAVGGGTTTSMFSSEIERITEDSGAQHRSGGGAMWAEIEGRGLTMASVGKVTTFEIGGRGLNVDDIEVRITGPNGKETPARVIAARTGNFRCEYVTTDVGNYRVELSLAGRPVDGSPFYVSSYAPQRVFIDPIPGGAVGQPVQFYVDANEAGKGQLEISVNQGRVPNNVQMQGSGRCLVTFIPEHVGTYVIDVTFNGELVRGCPIRVEIYDQDPSTGHIEHRQILTDTGSGANRFAPAHRTGSYSPTHAGSAATGQFGTSSTTSYQYEKREYSGNNGGGGHQTHTSSATYYFPGQPVTVQLTPQVQQHQLQHQPAAQHDMQHQHNVPIGGVHQHQHQSHQHQHQQHVHTNAPLGGHLPTTTASNASTTAVATTHIPPAPPPPPPVQHQQQPVSHSGGNILTKSWQHKSTPTESGAPMHHHIGGERRFESSPTVETKRFESMPISGETPHHKNGSAIYDRSSPEHARGAAITSTTTNRPPRVYETTSTVETHHQEEQNVTRSHHRHSPLHQERSREFDEIQRPATDRYRYDTGDQHQHQHVDERKQPPPQQTHSFGRKLDEDAGIVRKHDIERKQFEQHDQPQNRSYDFEERVRRFEGGQQHRDADDRSLGRTGTQPQHQHHHHRGGSDEDRTTGTTTKKYFERQQAPTTQQHQHTTREMETAPHGGNLRSEFEERLAARRRIETEERERTGAAAAAGGMTTVASYGLHQQQAQHDHRPTTTMPVAQSLRLEHELKELPADEWADSSFGSSSQRTMYSSLDKDSTVKPKHTTETHQHQAAREIPITRETRPTSEVHPQQSTTVVRETHVHTTNKPDVHGLSTRPVEYHREAVVQHTKPDTRVTRDIRRSPDQAYSGASSADELTIDEDEQVRRNQHQQQQHVGGGSMEKVDPKAIRVEFPEAGDAGGGVSVTRLRKPTFFEIKPAVFDRNDLKVNIVTPSKSSLDHRIRESRQGYIVEFTPTEVGTHKVHVQLRDEPLHQSPYVVKVYDSGRIQVAGIEAGTVGNPVQFTVDATNAGYGSLEIAIKDSEGNIIPSKVNAIQDSTSKFMVSFLPQKVDDYGIHVSFNQENLKGSPFITNVREGTGAAHHPSSPTQGVRETAVASTAATAVASQMASEIMHQAAHSPPPPSHQTASIQHQQQQYTQQQHQPQVANGVPKATTITTMSSGLTEQSTTTSSHTKTGTTATASTGSVGVAPPPPGTVPTEAKLAGEDGTKEKLLKLAPVGKTATMLVTNVEEQYGKPKADVQGPNGKFLHTQVVSAGHGTYKIEFGPSMVGDHVIEVKLADTHVQGSPFTCRVYDSRKIKVGEIPHGSVGKPVHFVVDASEAGVGNLEVAVNEGRIPSMAHGLGQHRYDISFVPKEPIEHNISVRFNNEAVPGSPFTCKVSQLTDIIVNGPGLERIPVRKPTHFIVDPQGAAPQNTNLHVTVKDPTSQEVPTHITGSAEKSYRIEYTPQVVGNHSIDIRYGDQQIQNNPFLVKAYDSSRVRLFPVEGNALGKACSFQIDAAKAGAGNMEIIVSVDGRNVPNFVTPEGNAKFRVSFTPQEPRQHVVSVKFNGEPVPGSPMTCTIGDDQTFSVIGDGLNQAVVGKPASFVVQAAEGSENDCNVVITAPSQKVLPSQMVKSDEGFKVHFVPWEIGPHLITVDRWSRSQGPFKCNVFDPSKVKVSPIGAGIIGKPVKAIVDISKAGDGTITADVEDHARKLTVPCQVTPTSMGSAYEVSFIPPPESSTLSLTIHFNGIDICGEDIGGNRSSPITCEIFDSCRIEANGTGLNLAQVDRPSAFTVDLAKKGANEEDLVVTILDPTKRLVPSSIKRSPTDHSKYLIEYVLKSIGSHSIDIQFAQYPILDSPFQCEVFDSRRVRLVDLKDGIVGKERMVKIDCSEAGKGYLDVFLRSKNSSNRLSVIPLEDNRFSCAFVPKTFGAHSIEVNYNGVALPDSPFEFSVRDTNSVHADGPGLRVAVAHKIAHFTVFLAGAGRGELDVVITAPDGGAVPVKCFQQKDGNFRVEYTPSHVGTHRIDITFGEHPIAGSPYTCEVFDPTRVAIQSETHGIIPNQPAAIRVNRKNAGNAALSVQVSDPNGKLLPVEVVPVSHNEDEIRFIPTSPGQHQISVSYGGHDVANSPIPVLFNADEPGMPSAYGDGLSRAIVNEQASFVVDVKKLKGELKVDVTDQNGQRAKHSVRKKGDGLYETLFTPISTGQYIVTLMWNNKQLHGSPFTVAVVDPSKILIPGASGDHRATEGGAPIRVGVQKEVKIDASSAGPGKLRAEVRSPSGKLPTKLDEIGHGHYKVGFTPAQEGEHSMHLFWSDVPVSHAPMVYWAERGAGGAVPTGAAVAVGEGVVLAESSKVHHKETTVVKKHKKDGTESPSMDKDGGRGIASTSDPSSIVVNTDSFRTGVIVGQETQALIDARSAGSGELTAQCVGPNKLAYCELYGRRDGTYTLHFRPAESGKHNLHVKYDGEHVPGSPFALSVNSPPDPSKVRVYGPGVEHGILSKFKSDFSVDTQGAGAGQLTVRVRGPKAAFNVEMVRETKFDRLIRCKYEPKEPGDYQIEVKWAGEHVPGSPFLVMIFDTQSELERFLSGQPVTPSPPLPFLPPGWVGPPPAGFMLPSPGGGGGGGGRGSPGGPGALPHQLPPPPALMMPPSPIAGGYHPHGPPPRALTYGPMHPPPGAFPVYAGGSPHGRNGF